VQDSQGIRSIRSRAGVTSAVSQHQCSQPKFTVNASNEKEISQRQGVVVNTLDLSRNGAVGFIDWLGLLQLINMLAGMKMWRDVSYHYEA